MAFKVALTTGNYSSAATWGKNANNGTIHPSTNINVGTAGSFTQSFTGVAGKKIAGVLVYPDASFAGRSLIFTLQANSVDTPSTVTIDGNDVPQKQSLFVRLPSDYTQAAGVTYRFKVATSSAGLLMAQSTTAGQLAAIIVNNDPEVPTTSDMVFVCAPNANTDITVTVDDTTATCGDNTVASSGGPFSPTYPRYWDMGLNILGGTTSVAKVVHKTNANTRLDVRNSVFVSTNGKYEQKPQAGYLAETTFTSGPIGLPNVGNVWFKFDTGSSCDIQGAGLSTEANWKSKFVSGLGTAASPLAVTAGTGSQWSVGDYLVLHGTSDSATNYAETEYRYIISKPTADTMVLSNTSGGSENALVYQHTNGYVFNNTAGKNVRWSSTDGNLYHMPFYNTTATSTNSKIRWARMFNLYSSGSAARGGLAPTYGAPLLEYLSFSQPGVQSVSTLMYIASTNSNQMSLKGLFAFNCSTANLADGVIQNNGILKTFIDCWIVDTQKRGWEIRSITTLNRCGVVAGQGNLIELYAGFVLSSSGTVLNDCEAHSQRNAAILLYPGGADIEFVRFLSGTKGKNGQTIRQAVSQAGYNTLYFDSPQIADNTIMDTYTTMLAGSQVVMANINNIVYNNLKFTNNGIATVTGTGLTDTTLSPLGNCTYRQEPTTAAGIKYRYTQTASPGANFLTYGKVWGNSTFVSDGATTITVDLYLPGQVEGVDTPTDTVTMTKTSTKTSSNAQFNLKGYYSGSIPSDALIVITIKNPNATPNAYAYIGDILNANNDVTKFKVMYQGQPSLRMPETAGESGVIATAVVSGVWSDTNTYPAASKGGILAKTKKLAAFIRNTM